MVETAIDQASTNLEWHDDYLIDTNTGEIVETWHGVQNPTAEPFRVDSLVAAEWVLDRMARREAALVALDKRRLAIIHNLDALANTEQRALDGLHRRFDAELEAFARAELERAGGRTKTLRTAFGSISFRIVKASRRIVDMAAAVAWAKRWTPQAVRVKEDVLLSEMEQWMGFTLLNGQTAAESLAEATWLEKRPQEERCHVKTGVED